MMNKLLSGCTVVALLLIVVPAAAQTHTETVTVDANANRRAIDPRIYGVAFADTAAQLTELNTPLHRSGGNNTTRYNWLQNAANHDFDYFFESISDGTSTAGESADTFVQNSKTALAQPMLTISMIGWVAKLGANRSILPSFSVAKYGAQCSVDPYLHDAGDGKKPSCSTLVTGNDPNDANVPSDANFQKAWVQHLVTKWGNAAAGGVKYYILDNEHSIWFSTHRDVHPEGPHHTEIRDKMIEYGTMIKSVDAGAIVMGPEEYGWTGYIFSGYDQQWSAINGYNNIPDRTAMGNIDYMPWLLAQLKLSYTATGVKPIDVFSLHYYPQQNEFSNTVDTATQLLRNRSTRSLWDPNYVDTSYIGDKVKLIPRMRNWVNTNYISGTPIAITEYNWGAENHINGATTQADIYGIFGREGLDIATRWTTPASNTPTFKAMKMYRNYDDAKSTFGDTSVSAAVANADNLSAFSALRTSDGALTTMVISKYLTGATNLTLALNNFVGTGVAQVYQLTSANAITRLADVSYAGTLAVSVPAQSITLFVMAPAPSGLAVNYAYSRRVHGALGPFDLQLNRAAAIGGAVTVEPRVLGNTHTIVFAMNTTVISTGAVTATDAASNPIGAPTVAFLNNEVRVTLTGLADNQRVKVKVANINNLGVDAEVSLGFLVGDMNSTRAVNASDISATKVHRNEAASAGNFRFDVDASGLVDQADVTAVKLKSGRGLQ
ncbi:MAG: glycoside hydrolase family 44 protein [Betaproteobacteria bacterium]